MATTHQQQVDARAAELFAESESEMRQSSTVRAAQAALDDAERTLAAYPYNDDAVRARDDAQIALNQAMNTFWREKRLRQLQAQKDEQARVIAEQQAEASAKAEAEAREDRRAAWLASGGTDQNFSTAWPSLWQAELVRRSEAQAKELERRVRRVTGSSPF